MALKRYTDHVHELDRPTLCLSLFRKTQLKTRINKRVKAVRKVAGMAPWKVPNQAIHLLLVSQDSEFLPPGMQLLRHFIGIRVSFVFLTPCDYR